MERDPEIEELLDMAKKAGVNAVEGKPATKANLDTLAYVARQTVIAQAACGMWRKWCIADPAELGELRCTAEIVQDLTGGPPVRLRWDFSRTLLRYLEVRS